MANDLFAAGARMAAEVRSRMAPTVTYRRGASSATVPATHARSQFQTDDGMGGMLSFESHDFLIPVADLILDAVAVTPQKGDRIETADGQAYEVHAPGRESLWRWADPYHNEVRVHTKQAASIP